MPHTSAPSSPVPHAADSHDLIRVHGARQHNLKDVSIALHKRRLTVFTGVSGSGKSSLAFATIAAESQRLINETYPSFVQNLMPSQARPEVDVLEALTAAIIVDQQRMGSDPRSTVGTATIDLTQLYDDSTGDRRGRVHHPRLEVRQLVDGAYVRRIRHPQPALAEAVGNAEAAPAGGGGDRAG